MQQAAKLLGSEPVGELSLQGSYVHMPRYPSGLAHRDSACLFGNDNREGIRFFAYADGGAVPSAKFLADVRTRRKRQVTSGRCQPA